MLDYTVTNSDVSYRLVRTKMVTKTLIHVAGARIGLIAVSRPPAFHSKIDVFNIHNRARIKIPD